MGVLDGKVAIVTGAGQGIGRGIALALAKEGAAVVIAEMNEEAAGSTASEIKELGMKALAITCNVRKRQDVEAVVAAAVDEFGTIDILVNNAQAARPAPLEEHTDEDMALALESGLMGTFYFMQTCFPYFKEHGGKIINFASGAGLLGLANFASYAATKEGIRGLTRVASREWGKHNINVNVVCPCGNSPGQIWWAETMPDQYQAFLATVPMGRIGDCEKDIGRAVVFLASPDSDYITGQTIMVDGGSQNL